MRYFYFVKSQKQKDFINIKLTDNSQEDEIKLLNAGFKKTKNDCVWYSENTSRKKAIAEEMCISDIYGIRLKISEILNSSEQERKNWCSFLTYRIFYYNRYAPITEETREIINKQKDAWLECFNFIEKELYYANETIKKLEFYFEYRLNKKNRPDIFIFTNKKILILEFKSGIPIPEDYAQTRRYQDNSR